MYDEYFPRTFASVVCTMGYANHLSGEGKYDEAIQLLLEIIYDTPFDDNYFKYAGHGNLAKIFKFTGRYQEAMHHINSALEFASEFSHGVEYNWYNYLRELQDQVLRRMVAK